MFRLIAISIALQIACVSPAWADAEVLEAERAQAAEQLAQHYAQTIVEAPEGIQRELAIIRSRILEVNQRLQVENHVLNNRQRELEIKDPIARGLREKVVAKEKELVELRRSLHSRLEAIPEIQELKSQRAKLVGQIKALREQERALLTSSGSGGASPDKTLNTGK